MPPFDIKGARGRGNPHPKRRQRPIPTKLYTPLTRRAIRQAPKPLTRRQTRKVISHRTVVRLQKRAAGRKRIERQKRDYRTGSVIPGVKAARRGVNAGTDPVRNRKIARAIPGVQAVANAKYKGHTERLWRRVRNEYGPYAGGSIPMSRILRANSPRYAAYVRQGPDDRGSRRVNFTPDVPLAGLLGEGTDEGAFYNYSVPLHEWTHVFQPQPRTQRGQQLNEGGADLMAIRLASRIRGGAYTPTSWQYAPFRKRARRKGRAFVTRGQFR